LKKELTAQRTLAAESKTLRSQIATLQAENQRVITEQKSLTSSLQTSQNEVKALSNKLSAARTNTQTETTTKVPGSAMKDRNQRGNSAAATASAKHDDEKHIMKLKEDLYSDLTNLLVHNVKRLEDQDIYDCSQTGRNGSKYLLFVFAEMPLLTMLFS
jgi:HD-GYP domain-containing protein (c-di-GMP phosphodiesterase class II)